jgi:hypothetical protein
MPSSMVDIPQRIQKFEMAQTKIFWLEQSSEPKYLHLPLPLSIEHLKLDKKNYYHPCETHPSNALPLSLEASIA